MMLKYQMSAAMMAICTVAVTSTAWAQAPARWQCEQEAYGDGVCDCGCGATDSDCSTRTFEGCERHACPDGAVPWEHQPSSCMGSACGDGWRDVNAGEVCDDAEALTGGGCNASCSAVNEGWVCGDMADGCERASDMNEPDVGVDMGVDMGEGDTDEPAVDMSTPDMGNSDEPDLSLEADLADEPSASNDQDDASGGCTVASVQAPSSWWRTTISFLPHLRRR